MGNYKLNFLQNFDCAIIHQNIDIGIEYFLEKVLNFDFFCQDNKSFIPFEYNPFEYNRVFHDKIKFYILRQNLHQTYFNDFSNVKWCMKQTSV